MDTLKHIGKVISTIPKGFTPHSGVKRVYAARAKAIEVCKNHL
jgi:2-oxoglutarate dehydrogenase complex dehydrogenase (E1) component-like enzyme